MQRKSPGPLLLVLLCFGAAAARSQPPAQTSADAYTRYELLDPETESFRIVYDVTATTAGATHYYNPIRKGSAPTVHGVEDRHTGRALRWRLVRGADAARRLAGADPEMTYLEIELARPVPAGGEARLRIDKTYRDARSYFDAAGHLVFERDLGVPRNAVVLPPGYELVRSTMPVQVRLEGDRVVASFLNRNPGPAPLRLEARALPAAAVPPDVSSATAPPADDTGSGSAAIEERPATTRLVPSSARRSFTWTERARQDREIVYFLQQPETHAFRLYHDYTESRPGVDRYLNVVRPGSRALDPEARILDTGEQLEVETLRGDDITAKGIELGAPVADDTEVVVIWFEPVAAGASVRLRIEETYVDAGRYGLDGDELLWDRSFGRPDNVVLLPPGWWLTASSIPATVDLDEEGRVRLRFVNDRPDAVDVLLRARRRPAAADDSP